MKKKNNKENINMFGNDQKLIYKEKEYATLGYLFIEMEKDDLSKDQMTKVLKDIGFTNMDIEMIFAQYKKFFNF